ncbi:probable U3 small nucleolar RNA-associated protein 11 [Coccinella septempunctata]|uniref:probable U3 small nucleolar RNA-associated protein 11 n=1 Tax=Coccinella septempunctata TaxID=41139 RepID=UPI001D0861F8|nr:probable U3 small nucleolar RNA-associated protein 11 [Coccinella septempunctata]
MSVWKKASKAHQKVHAERHQPEERKHLGILEKKKDYIKRARDRNEKKETLKLLRKRALNKNPDEFYHHMINAKVDRGMHFDKETEDEDTPEQIKLMKTQDLKYIINKRNQERKKIEKLQAQLHLISIDMEPVNKHIYFDKEAEKAAENRLNKNLLDKELPDIDEHALIKSTNQKKHLYDELAKRINREKELAVVEQKLEMQRHIASKSSVLPPKKVNKGGRYRAPVYVWQYERKK